MLALEDMITCFTRTVANGAFITNTFIPPFVHLHSVPLVVHHFYITSFFIALTTYKSKDCRPVDEWEGFCRKVEMFMEICKASRE